MLSGRWVSSVLYAGLTVAFAIVTRGQDASFLLEASSPQPYTAAYLGNGIMSVVTTPLATQPAQYFLAGV
jgi:hypothetical protein